MKNTMTYGGGNPGLGFGQAKKCGRVKFSNTVKLLHHIKANIFQLLC
jgi:hypothetical protein